MDLQNKIMEVLKQVNDPEIGINIVDLGLVYDVIIEDDKISINMTLTTPGCPMHDSIITWVKTVVKKEAEDREVIVNLVWEPQWTPEKMSAEAKMQLGM
jgi:metal-sulfur cluster biosynthetic enzyme